MARPRPKRNSAAKICTSATVQNAEIAHSTLIFTAVTQNHGDGTARMRRAGFFCERATFVMSELKRARK